MTMVKISSFPHFDIPFPHTQVLTLLNPHIPALPLSFTHLQYNPFNLWCLFATVPFSISLTHFFTKSSFSNSYQMSWQSQENHITHSTTLQFTPLAVKFIGKFIYTSSLFTVLFWHSNCSSDIANFTMCIHHLCYITFPCLCCIELVG